MACTLRAIRTDALLRMAAAAHRHVAQLKAARAAASVRAIGVDAVRLMAANGQAERTLVDVVATLRPPVDGDRLHVTAARMRSATVAGGTRIAAETGRQVVAADERVAGPVEVAFVDVTAVGAVAGGTGRTGGAAVEWRRGLRMAFDTCVMMVEKAGANVPGVCVDVGVCWLN